MKEYHNKKVDVNDLLCVNQLLFSYGFLAVKEEKSVHGVPHETDHVRCECDQKQEKELVVLVTETIVHKRAVMVKALHALVAVVAVHCVLGAQILTVDADVVQCNSSFTSLSMSPKKSRFMGTYPGSFSVRQ